MNQGASSGLGGGIGMGAMPWIAGVADSVDTIEKLVPGATERRPVRSSDAKSGASFEQMTIEGVGPTS